MAFTRPTSSAASALASRRDAAVSRARALGRAVDTRKGAEHDTGKDADVLQDAASQPAVIAKTERELSAMQTRDRIERRRFENVTDSEYWVCLCFESREQKEAFLRAVYGPRLDEDKYVNGIEFAEKVGVRLPRDASAFHGTQVSRRWIKHAGVGKKEND